MHNIVEITKYYLYMRREVPEKDSKKAIFWIQKAAENGSEFAYDNLARMSYELGIGSDVLYEKSAEKGFINAKFHLRYCYINGIGTKIDK
ncbi:kinase-like domain-containing protein [Rhizophagus clarus]|uniref:Kinase-like domain-containing protein n=1 Tax=Rhizophagus clarus TaxID=94130 RepID=A0A8H3QNQ4_9GLOM|nr:kinase-like domain-containing protein [Rhizophagus clarus]